jgi:hypothetical protein
MKITENQNIIKATSPLRTKAQTFFPYNKIQTHNSSKFNHDDNIYIFTSNLIKET